MLITGICYLGNISRTQNVKKDKISFPFTSIVLLSIIKLPTVNICQISRKTLIAALKTQSNFKNCFLKRDLSVAEDLSV